MDAEHAKPGDTIEIIWCNPYWNGKRFKVVEPPDDALGSGFPGDAWFLSENGYKRYFFKQDYVIVESNQSSLGNTEDVDASLKRQLNDNLRNLFT